LVRDAKILARYFQPAIRSQITAFSTEDARFGEWVTAQPCGVIRDVINTLDSLRHKIAALPELNEKSIVFLKAFTFYYSAHQKLQMDA
jgi:hypothetical protein